MGSLATGFCLLGNCTVLSAPKRATRTLMFNKSELDPIGLPQVTTVRDAWVRSYQIH